MPLIQRRSEPASLAVAALSVQRTALWVLGLCVLTAAAQAQTAAERGKVVFALAGGCGCHTPPEGPVGAGGGKIPTPFGTFFGSNITPDRETGIGQWSDAEIRDAIRTGIAGKKGAESPAMPYYYYAGMSDADVADLVAYLRTLPPVRRPNQPPDGGLPLARVAYRVWRMLFFHPQPPPATAPTAAVERGRYLVDHVSICPDCHTPRNLLGAPDRSLYLAGLKHGPGGAAVPNITPHATGIGDWGADDIVAVLTRGMLPNFDNVQGLMADVVDGHGGGLGYKDAPERDWRAVAAYLGTVPPIDNKVDGK
jgi:mono/diheme cytochrome c family protein